jgi:serine/threonine-protein kinase
VSTDRQADAPATGDVESRRFVPGARVAARYKLLHTLGRGPFGEVFCACCEATGEHVAIKLADAPGLDTARALDAFRTEERAAALAAAASTHALRVLEIGVDGGMPFLVAERVNARTLAQELDRVGVLAPDRLLGLFEQVTEALGGLHAAGFVHGDVRPATVLIHGGPTGPLAKLADFGAAHEADAARIDAPAAALVPYASPEALAGGPIDARGDVWSLGVVAYESLTGHKPFVAPTAAAVREAIAQRPHVPATRRRPGLPGPLDGFFDRALAKARDARFADARDVALALRDALAASALTTAP